MRSALLHHFLIIAFVCLLPALSIEIPWKCYGCRGGVELLRLLYERNATADKVLEVADFVCRHFADQDSFICRGITTQFRSEFLYVLGRLVFSPGQLCGMLISDCGTPLDPFDTNWTVPLPPKPPSPPPRPDPPPTRRPLRILQLSDLHIDLDYAEGSEADCGEPVCCVDNRNRRTGSGGELRQKAGRWGTLADCDIPLRTVENMLEHISRTHTDLDLVLLSGDYMNHRDWTYTRARHLSQLDLLAALLRRHFYPRVPVLWTLGNHEGVPVNAFAPHFVPAEFGPRWMYRAMLRAGNRTARLPAGVRHSAVYRGSYSVLLAPSLRLISLNNGYCDSTNLFIYLNQTDPDGSLTWLVDQLWSAEKANESVYILAHIPPGDNECLESWSRNYYLIVNRFSDTISAQFFGHVHTDSFSLFYEQMNNASSRPLSVAYIAPSVTTYPRLNPAYRIYSARPDNGHILDFETYFLNLSTIEDQVKDQPKWELLYTAKAEYGLEDMSAASWNALVGRIEREPTLAQKFNRNYARRDDVPCDARCLAQRVCAMRASHHNPKALCGSGRRKGNGGGRRQQKRRKAIDQIWAWMARGIRGRGPNAANDPSDSRFWRH